MRRNNGTQQHVCHLALACLIPPTGRGPIQERLPELSETKKELRQGPPFVQPLRPVSLPFRPIHALSLMSLAPLRRNGTQCEHGDVSGHGRGSVFTAIYSAKDIHSLACGAVLDILGNQHRAREAVAAYFEGVNRWFTIVDQPGFEVRFDDMWEKPSAETCVLVLAMSIVASPPSPKSGKGMGDAVYHSTKAILSLVQSSLPMSTQLLQAELLVALYEFSHSMPQQAYLSLGRCVHMARAFGWHNKTFWSDVQRASGPRELKLCSILWWEIVYVDG